MEDEKIAMMNDEERHQYFQDRDDAIEHEKKKKKAMILAGSGSGSFKKYRSKRGSGGTLKSKIRKKGRTKAK